MHKKISFSESQYSVEFVSDTTRTSSTNGGSHPLRSLVLRDTTTESRPCSTFKSKATLKLGSVLHSNLTHLASVFGSTRASTNPSAHSGRASMLHRMRRSVFGIGDRRLSHFQLEKYSSDSDTGSTSVASSLEELESISDDGEVDSNALRPLDTEDMDSDMSILSSNSESSEVQLDRSVEEIMKWYREMYRFSYLLDICSYYRRESKATRPLMKKFHEIVGDPKFYFNDIEYLKQVDTKLKGRHVGNLNEQADKLRDREEKRIRKLKIASIIEESENSLDTFSDEMSGIISNDPKELKSMTNGWCDPNGIVEATEYSSMSEDAVNERKKFRTIFDLSGLMHEGKTIRHYSLLFQQYLEKMRDGRAHFDLFSNEELPEEGKKTNSKTLFAEAKKVVNSSQSFQADERFELSIHHL